MSAPQSPSLALAALLLLGGVPATAQSLASEVQALANDLAVEGYSGFTLETPVLQDPVLVAVKEDIVLELTLDPATLDITDVVVAVDDDGDGRLSNRERRGAMTAEGLPANASDRARAAISMARERQAAHAAAKAARAAGEEIAEGAAGAALGQGAAGQAAPAAAARARASNATAASAGGKAGGNAGGNAGGRGNGKGAAGN